mmetsp:Transcript_3929/g.4360  ORF Transcript_3929/g.4360 Transcript_3929/m.4360 type:complete len:142 (-) Transcript_3929:539-964(-)
METASEKTCAYCGLPPVKNDSNIDIKLKVCSRCKNVYYHGLECQQKHWKAGHKKECEQTLAQRKKAGGFCSSNKNAGIKKKKTTAHYSMDQIHQLVTRRFKELRAKGISTQDSMKQARDEFQPSEHEMDPGTKVASMFGMR